MRNVDIAYLAGLIDGEGTISFMRRGNKHLPIVSIANTNREVLIWCRKKVNLGCAICIKQPKFAHHSISYHIRWTYNNAIDIVTMCFPYLIIKKKQAKLLLRWKDVVVRNGKYTSKELKLRNHLIIKMSRANSRPNRERLGVNSL